MFILTQSLLLIHTYAASSSSLEDDDVDFANSGGGMDIDMGMDSSCKSNASQHLEKSAMEVDGNDEMDTGGLLEGTNKREEFRLKDRLSPVQVSKDDGNGKQLFIIFSIGI